MTKTKNSGPYPLSKKIQITLPVSVADWIDQQPEPSSGPTGADMIRELNAWTMRIHGGDESRTPTASESRAIGILHMLHEGVADLQKKVEAMEADQVAKETHIKQLDEKNQHLESQARLSNKIINHLRDLFIISVGGVPPERQP